MDESKMTNKPAVSPMTVLLLGACPAMALSTDVRVALTLGITVTVIMAISSLIMAGLSKLLGKGARLAAIVLVNTFLVSASELLIRAYLPKVYGMMGIYLALCAVNLMIFAAGENAEELSAGKALGNSLLTGLCFTIVILCVAAVRELFGSGSLAGYQLAFFKAHTISILAQAPGGFMVYAFGAAVAGKVFNSSIGGKGLAMEAVGLDKEDEA
jgi:electron transport complex protein RnfE